MKTVSLWIQSILYKNEKESIYKTIESLANAVRVEWENTKNILKPTLCYGDASPKQVFDEKEIEELKIQYAKYLDIKYIVFHENTGTAKGHNRMAKKCQKDYMMIMNPDLIVSPRYFIDIMRPFSNEALKAGLVEARQTPVEHPKEYDTITGETGWAATACCVFPTSIFHEVNGFDQESFFMYCDDLDFSWRIRLLGYKIIYQPLSPVYHAKRLGSKGEWIATSAEKYYSAEAALLMAHKWSHPEEVEKILKEFRKSRDSDLMKAAETYLERKKEGKLPQPIDPDHKVGFFKHGYYTKHRFTI